MTRSPYDDENIDSKGKSYLKWTLPGINMKFNLI